MPYAFVHQDKAFGPSGLIKDTSGVPTLDASAYNAELERQEIRWLKTGPERVFLYYHEPPTMPDSEYGMARTLRTWLGTVVSANVQIGPRRNVGFAGSYRRAVSARIFGVLYHGWYFESSGNYCRLKRAKRQS